MLKVRGRRCVIIGGGAVAQRRAAALLSAGAEVTVIATRIRKELATLKIAIEHRPYRPSDLAGALLAIVATDDPKVNAQVSADARAAGTLVNRADEPDEGDVTVPAHNHHGPVTVAVDTGGRSAAAAAAIRRELSATLDPNWPRLLDMIKPVREQIQRTCTDPDRRRKVLARLSNPDALDRLKSGGADALRQYWSQVSSSLHPDSGHPSSRGHPCTSR